MEEQVCPSVAEMVVGTLAPAPALSGRKMHSTQPMTLSANVPYV
jgi:hypothetical protein